MTHWTTRSVFRHQRHRTMWNVLNIRHSSPKMSTSCMSCRNTPGHVLSLTQTHIDYTDTRKHGKNTHVNNKQKLVMKNTTMTDKVDTELEANDTLSHTHSVAHINTHTNTHFLLHSVTHTHQQTRIHTHFLLHTFLIHTHQQTCTHIHLHLHTFSNTGTQLSCIFVVELLTSAQGIALLLLISTPSFPQWTITVWSVVWKWKLLWYFCVICYSTSILRCTVRDTWQTLVYCRNFRNIHKGQSTRPLANSTIDWLHHHPIVHSTKFSYLDKSTTT